MRARFAKKIKREDLRQLQNFRLNPPQSIERLADRLGILVFEVELDHGLDGYLDYLPNLGSKTGYVVYINKDLNTLRKRWTLAHELGHYFLHRQSREESFDMAIHRNRDPLENWLHENEEKEANYFAEDLFFGAGALEAAVTLHGRNIPHLARKVFGVPEQAVEIALQFKGQFTGKGLA